MTIYFEGNGKSAPVTVYRARDQLMVALKEMRDEVLNDPKLESYDDSTQRDLVVANEIIKGTLGIFDGNSDHYPAVNLIPYVPDSDVEEAIAAGADYFDSCSGDIGQALSEYWTQVNS